MRLTIGRAGWMSWLSKLRRGFAGSSRAGGYGPICKVCSLRWSARTADSSRPELAISERLNVSAAGDMAGDERRQRAGDILLPVCRRREQLQLGARIMPHQTPRAGGMRARPRALAAHAFRPRG